MHVLKNLYTCTNSNNAYQWPCFLVAQNPPPPPAHHISTEHENNLPQRRHHAARYRRVHMYVFHQLSPDASVLGPCMILAWIQDAEVLHQPAHADP